MVNDWQSKKLYVQLQPDTPTVEYIQSLQQSLNKQQSVHLVSESELHVTVIHIGAVSRLLESMRDYTDMTPEDILSRLPQLAAELTELVTPLEDTEFVFNSKACERFGTQGRTYVVTFGSTDTLDDLHAASLAILKAFFEDCLIADIETFMAADSNLKNGLSLRPHLAIAKGYIGQDINMEPKSLRFSVMPVVYAT